mmetsp:Transcript_3017/g.12384  ORF Transcript_3017/g.12384 Transcript_3017/m.12384 type:complete len:233 (+) Transcript_3017:107-805(+)
MSLPLSRRKHDGRARSSRATSCGETAATAAEASARRQRPGAPRPRTGLPPLLAAAPGPLLPPPVPPAEPYSAAPDPSSVSTSNCSAISSRRRDLTAVSASARAAMTGDLWYRANDTPMSCLTRERSCPAPAYWRSATARCSWATEVQSSWRFLTPARVDARCVLAVSRSLMSRQISSAMRSASSARRLISPTLSKRSSTEARAWSTSLAAWAPATACALTASRACSSRRRTS